MANGRNATDKEVRVTQTAIVPGSLAYIARQDKTSLAETFLDAEAVIICDISASMSASDSRGGLSRHAVACSELARLQREMPGKLAVIEFSAMPMFVPGGILSAPQSSTDLAAALRFARVADVPGMRFFIISDGIPDDATAALAEARQYKAHISTVYVGPEGESSGREFLAQLAAVTGGSAVKAERVMELADTMTRLLQAGR